jgi:peptidoglycan/LPS O-acetylase OafA/YrhL
VSEPRFFGVFPLWNTTINFNAGVDFFFVLSGFIIAYVHQDDIGERDRIYRFAKNRIIRIYPLYWLILTALLVIFALAPGYGKLEQLTAQRILTSYVLLPMTLPPIIGVAWSLTYEMFYYLIFGLFILLGRRMILPVGLVLVAVATVNGSTPLTYPYSFLLSPYHVHFTMGAILGVSFDRMKVQRPGLLATTTATALILGLFCLDPAALHTRYVFAACSAGMIAALAASERARPMVGCRLLGWLGSASYAIYLIHPVIGPVIVRLLAKVPQSLMNPHLAALLMAVSGIGSGIILHFAVERPLLDFIKKRRFAHIVSIQGASQRMLR